MITNEFTIRYINDTTCIQVRPANINSDEESFFNNRCEKLIKQDIEFNVVGNDSGKCLYTRAKPTS